MSNNVLSDSTYRNVSSKFEQSVADRSVLQLLHKHSGLAFSVLDKSKAKIIAEGFLPYDLGISEPVERLKQVITSEEIFAYDFTQVIYTEVNQNFTFVPATFYDETNNDRYLKVASFFEDQMTTKSHLIENQKAFNVFQFNTAIKSYLERYFGRITVNHHQSVLIEGLSLINRNGLGKSVNINLNEQLFDLSLFNDGRLMLSNSFYYKAWEDVLYYTLFSIEKLNLAVNETKVSICGNGNIDTDKIKKQLEKYFKSVVYLEDPKFIDSLTESKNGSINYLEVNAFLCA